MVGIDSVSLVRPGLDVVGVVRVKCASGAQKGGSWFLGVAVEFVSAGVCIFRGGRGLRQAA